MQTSGEYGNFFFREKSNRLFQAAATDKKSSPQWASSRAIPVARADTLITQVSPVAVNSARGSNSAREYFTNDPATTTTAATTHLPRRQIASAAAPHSARSQMRLMLHDLDSSFPRRNKADLISACAIPVDSAHQLKNYAIANINGAQLAEPWSGSLRRTRK